MVTKVGAPAVHKYGTKAGAQAWWKRLAPGGVVPKDWLSGKVIIKDSGPYHFAGQTDNGGSTTTPTTVQGHGNITWITAGGEDGLAKDTTDNLYVSWNATSGKQNAEPETPDAGEVVPTSPFDWVSSVGQLVAMLTKLFNRDLWVRIGEGAAGVLILIIAIYLMTRKR